MIKAIYFDFDGVLTTDERGGDTLQKGFRDIFGVSKEEFNKSYPKHNNDIKLGRKTFSDIWEDMTTTLERSIPIEKLPDVFFRTPINEDMIGVVIRLKKAGFSVGVYTSNSSERMDVLSEKYNFNSLFDVMHLTSHVGVHKDEQKFFDTALERIGAQPAETIIIDNHEHNLQLPAENGSHVYFFDTEKNDILGLVDYLGKQGAKI